MQCGGIPLNSDVRTAAGAKFLFTAFYHTAMAEPIEKITNNQQRAANGERMRMVLRPSELLLVKKTWKY